MTRGYARRATELDNNYTPEIMWCPSVSLSVWVNAWLAGAAAPDDVLDALSRWAPRHSVTAYDAEAATRTGLPWPDLTDAGAVSLLQTLRTAAGSQRDEPAVALALPVPGDVRGLPAGTQFQRDAVAVGEAVLVYGDPAGPVGLVPDFDTDGESDADEFDPGFGFDAGFGAGLDGAGAPDRDPGPHTLCWTVYSAPPAPRTRHRDLGEAEFELRSAVRAAADALGTLRAGATGSDVGDPRGMVERILESARGHGAPEHSPERALRVLENAAHVDAIITVSSGLMPIGLQSSSEIRIANDALRPLSVVVRSARLAAVDAILGSAWRSR